MAPTTNRGVDDPMRDGGRSEVLASDFRISWTDSKFHWAGEPRPGLPLLRWPGGAVCEPAWIWFAHSVACGRVVASSLAAQVYALRLWLAWLWRRGVPWQGATDQLLREWRAERLAQTAPPIAGAGKRRSPSKRQVERGLSTVFAFYSGLPEAMVLDGDARPFPPFVGHARAATGHPITARIVRVETPFGKVERVSWRWAGRVPRRTIRRATPAASDIARLMEQLRSRGTVSPSCRPTRRGVEQRLVACDRDWLMARCMDEAGFRAQEVADLTLTALARAFEEAGAPDMLRPCDSAAELKLRHAILTRLDVLEAEGRKIIEVEVTCKGSTRAAPLPLRLAQDLLSVWLWGGRIAMLPTRPRATSAAWLPDAVFLSLKTGMALKPGSVSDIVQEGFRAIRLRSSGHRLRAAFAERLALQLLRSRLALNGSVLDAAVQAWVIRRVADALGHSSGSTVPEHYVDRAILRLDPEACRRREG